MKIILEFSKEKNFDVYKITNMWGTTDSPIMEIKVPAFSNFGNRADNTVGARNIRNNEIKIEPIIA